jgi:hypothetical protein
MLWNWEKEEETASVRLSVCVHVCEPASAARQPRRCHAMPCHAMPCHAMQCNAMRCGVSHDPRGGRAEQGRAEQGRAGQSRAGQSRAEQGRAGQGSAATIQSQVLGKLRAHTQLRSASALASK